ncbi:MULTISPECIES: tetratricopeptide repeat protein [unclassified Treponema]|uniref:tetratricopeptide repeat protein n=1 Tax=unclassified Treponema TaxID=2638727 RepID=UPI0020A57ADC|nr:MULTISPECIES: hypothetical protein [unclassified Treponema]UTC67600.1 hypothetical protein E4O06_02715 [Treponema sp. OMZ 789]UTC70327.1 hypothetical protein E4O01_02705 [Treponema sp. OMZ 790]UTC73042.1 hypothetical protein E4O02_02705 [Treponema sp. OMZ 791]
MEGKKKKIGSVSKFTLIFFIFSASYLFAQNKPDALVLYKNGRYAEAVAVCEAEIKQTPNNLDSYVVMTWALLADGKYQKTYDMSAAGRKIAQSDPRLIATQAEACYHLGKNSEALKLFQDYISYAPNGVRISSSYYFMGEIYLRMAKYRHADISFSVAVTLDSFNSLWWVRLGYAREQIKEYRYSLEAYNKALSLNKNLIDAQKGRERVLQRF